MAHRYRMQVTADTGGVALADPPPVAPTAPPEAGRFHVLIIVEDVITSDGRLFVPGSLSWRDLPLPLMAHDENTPEHLGSVLIGNIDTIERRGNELHGWGSYLSAPDDQAAQLISLVQSGELRGISADVEPIAYDILIPTTDSEGNPLPDMFMALFDEGELAETPTENIDGVEYDVIEIPMDVWRVTEGLIMGATVEPFPAFQQAFIEDDSGAGQALVASARGRMFCRMRHDRVDGIVLQSQALTAAAQSTLSRGPSAREAYPERFTFPDIPPRDWFEVPETPGPMPLTILDSGQVFGHLAVWGECHVGIAGECVEAPPSPSNYARFHVGEIPVDDGGRVAVGRLTFATGHADTHLNAQATRAHYDNTGTAGADIRCSDGQYGIWCAGAARPGLTVAQIREVMASPPSGDWRLFGNELELVAALCVNVPGFNTPRASVRRMNGLVASLIVSHPAPPLTASGQLDRETYRRAVDRIAASIGRSTKDRRAALHARVHGG